VKNSKHSRRPRGLRWKSDSPYIWFSRRDSRGKQHQQSSRNRPSYWRQIKRHHSRALRLRTKSCWMRGRRSGLSGVDVLQKALFRITNEPTDLFERRPLRYGRILSHSPLSQLGQRDLEHCRDFLFCVHAQGSGDWLRSWLQRAHRPSFEPVSCAIGLPTALVLILHPFYASSSRDRDFGQIGQFRTLI
jgi:hypothetical protein